MIANIYATIRFHKKDLKNEKENRMHRPLGILPEHNSYLCGNKNYVDFRVN
jgi:hypothetical protein